MSKAYQRANAELKKKMQMVGTGLAKPPLKYDASHFWSIAYAFKSLFTLVTQADDVFYACSVPSDGIQYLAVKSAHIP